MNKDINLSPPLVGYWFAYAHGNAIVIAFGRLMHIDKCILSALRFLTIGHSSTYEYPPITYKHILLAYKLNKFEGEFEVTSKRSHAKTQVCKSHFTIANPKLIFSFICTKKESSGP